jgi:hypothetical protein
MVAMNQTTTEASRADKAQLGKGDHKQSTAKMKVG